MGGRGAFRPRRTRPFVRLRNSRHHAVSLAYVVPVAGDCQPTQEALDLVWYAPEEAVSEAVRREMTGGHDRLIRLTLAHVGTLP